MSEQTVKRLLWACKVLISIGILVFLIQHIPLADVLTVVSQASLGLWVWGFLIGVLTLYLDSVQMHQIMRVQAISLNPWQILVVNVITQFYSLFLPGYLAGGVIRWYQFAKPDKRPAEALAALLLNRLLDIIVLLGLGLFFWIIDVHGGSHVVWMKGIVLLLSGMTALYVLSFNRQAHQALRVLFHMPWCPAVVATKGGKVLQALQQYGRLSWAFHGKIFLLAVLRHLLMLAIVYLFALSLGMTMSYVTLGWVRSVSNLLLMLPISIAGLGVREAIFVYLLQPFGVVQAAAMGLSLLIFARSMVFGILGGLLEFKRVVVNISPKTMLTR